MFSAPDPSPPSSLFPTNNSIIHHILRRGRELLISLNHLIDRFQEVVLGHRLASRPNGEHPRLRAHAPDLRSRGVGTEPSQQFEPNSSLARHRPRVDLKDLRPPLQIRQRELHLSVQPPRAFQRGIQRVGAIGGHEDLDIPAGVEPVELIDQLQHGVLDVGVAAVAVAVESRAADAVHFVEEDLLAMPRGTLRCTPSCFAPAGTVPARSARPRRRISAPARSPERG